MGYPSPRGAFWLKYYRNTAPRGNGTLQGIHQRGSATRSCWVQRLELHQRFPAYEAGEIAASPLCQRTTGHALRSKQGKILYVEQKKGDTKEGGGKGARRKSSRKLVPLFRLLSCIHHTTLSGGHSRTSGDNFSIALLIFRFTVLGS